MAKKFAILAVDELPLCRPKEVKADRRAILAMKVFSNDGLIQLFLRRKVWQTKLQEKLG
jgi:hypothetical protein